MVRDFSLLLSRSLMLRRVALNGVHLLHFLVIDALALRLAVLLRVQVLALLVGGLLDFGLDGVGLGVAVLPGAGHLPRHLHARLAARYLEAAPRNLLGDVHRGEATYARKLVAEIGVERRHV